MVFDKFLINSTLSEKIIIMAKDKKKDKKTFNSFLSLMSTKKECTCGIFYQAKSSKGLINTDCKNCDGWAPNPSFQKRLL